MRHVYKIQKYDKNAELFNKSYAREASSHKDLWLLPMNPAVFSEDDFVDVDEDQNQVNEQASSAAIAQPCDDVIHNKRRSRTVTLSRSYHIKRYTTTVKHSEDKLKSIKRTREKEKIVKKKLFEDETDTFEEDVENLCDDKSEYSEEETLCTICWEMEESNEMWYRCRCCGKWAHKECSCSDRQVDYVCVFCLDP
ncbi:hypothetical protein HHI36_021556 [Cryptolaemus montrouzieri]|uniref:Zinc finger PHD-type domain-containing protein n=1 Tax=Cryptolaemus montrouzieri TaxID=559131 RepID=A0ABD2MXA6_9CUCU